MRRKKATMINQMHQAQEEWNLVLDTLEGMVRQTVERGWTEDQARTIVAGSFQPRTDNGDVTE